ncbi:MAG: MBL fold metallo-hydrolase [Candidatus Hodarchaeales archaeon]|jgi:ribonuclease BN (tRNA processing enzyme)
MIIGMIGSRGTVPTSEDATVSFLVDNKLLFECPSEIVQAFQRFQEDWKEVLDDSTSGEITALGSPSLGKISHIILSHLHYDHWGGILHILHRIMLLEREKREKKPLILIIPKNSTLPFQLRMNHVFGTQLNNFPLKDDDFLIRLLSIEIGTLVSQILRIEVIESEQIINLDQGYNLTCFENKHLPEGSVAYKLTYNKVKLDVNKAQKLGIPFDITLKKIERNVGSVVINRKKIVRSDIFHDIDITLGYSGDTAIDTNLMEFFKDCGILIHESTYLDKQESYHLDLHSDLQSLIDAISDFDELYVLVPIHFSIRYTAKIITQTIKEVKKQQFAIVNPLKNLILQIDHKSIVTCIKKPN